VMRARRIRSIGKGVNAATAEKSCGEDRPAWPD
jgi:hypothetical protein